MERVENDDQLAGVIAHEVGHITARHAVKRLQASYGAMLLQILAVETGKGEVATGVNLALNTIFSEYSQQDEFEADRLAVKYMRKAGYDPNEMVNFLKILREKQEKEPSRPKVYWRTHPNLPQRIAVTNKEIQGKLEFKDYLNIIQADDPVAH
jgi:predicted Zn-dependent protease